MNSLDGNCWLKLNYLICGSKNVSSRKKKRNSPEKSIIKETVSSKNIINEMNSSSRILSAEKNIPKTSLYQTLNQEKSHEGTAISNENYQKIIASFNSSIEHSSIDHRSSDYSHSTSNDQIIIKDVILHRNNRHERLGLTLSYGLTENFETNIYIEEVEKNSIAHRQGKLHRGDQIIQINYHRVTNRDQAIQLIYQYSTIIFQIIPFQFVQRNFSAVDSTITENDSGIILAFNTDLERIDQNWPNRTNFSSSTPNHSSNIHQDHFHFLPIESRRSLSLNDLINHSSPEEEEEEIFNWQCSNKHSITDESLFQFPTDDEERIVKPLPLNTYKHQFRYRYSLPTKSNRRLTRQQHQFLTSTDQQKINEYKQGKDSNKQQQKKQFRRSKRYDKRTPFIQKSSNNSTTEDFNLLNRIFLRENEKELKEKPYLAIKYQQESNLEKEKLKGITKKSAFHQPLTSLSTTNISLNDTQNQTSTIFI